MKESCQPRSINPPAGVISTTLARLANLQLRVQHCVIELSTFELPMLRYTQEYRASCNERLLAGYWLSLMLSGHRVRYSIRPYPAISGHIRPAAPKALGSAPNQRSPGPAKTNSDILVASSTVSSRCRTPTVGAGGWRRKMSFEN